LYSIGRISSVIPASRITNSMPPGRSFTSTTDDTNTAAGPTIERPGSRMMAKPVPVTAGRRAAA